MDMTFRLPDEMSRQLRELPNPEQFVREALQHALNNRDQRRSALAAHSSKWAKLVRRIHDEPGGLRGYSTRLQQDMQEFRDNFAFTHEVDDEVSA